MAQDSAVQGLAAATAPEQSPQATEKPAQSEPMLSERLAQIARKEKALHQMRKQLAQEKSQWESQKVQKPSNALTPEEWKTRLLNDPHSLGISPDEVANLFVNQASPEQLELRKLKAEIEALRGEQKQTVETVNTAQKQAYDQAIKQITNEVKLLVDGNEAFETIKATDSVEAVVELIESTYKEEGKLLDVETAAKQVEDYLYNHALTLAKLKKVSSALTPKEEPKEVPLPEGKKQVSFVAKAAAEKQQHPTTLTHSITQSSPTAKNTAAERRSRAIAAMMGQLKN